MTENEFPEQSNVDDLDWNSPCPYCGDAQRSHVWEDHPNYPSYWHRLPCAQEVEVIRKDFKQSGVFVRTFLALGVLLAFIVSFIFSWLASLHWAITALAIGLSVYTLALQLLSVYFPFWRRTKWYKDKAAIEQRKDHYFYHCERNPVGFARLKAENFERLDQDQ